MEISKEHLDTVCQAGKGVNCCSFLAMGIDGWSCAKDPGQEDLLASILEARPRMTAQGNNCAGWARIRQ